ncbi:MAG: L,D-transpeptidase [Campylobacterota bacterium]|nr:L,D-transpeptidase [Campylobacterota bacterium]
MTLLSRTNNIVTLTVVLFSFLFLSAANAKSYSEFKKGTNFPKTNEVFTNQKLLKKANGKNTKVKIDISEQRIKLYVNDKVAICSPATTGKKYKRTPKGNFKITEKIQNKRSSIFGKLYRGKKMVYKGDRRKYKGKYTRYQGAALKSWMRLTSDGIGIHGSKYIFRVPHSNGCVRVPYDVVGKIYSSVGTGTKVSVVQ